MTNGCCCSVGETLSRLWVHENLRVFQDRLVDAADRTYLQRLLHTLLKSRFDTKLSYEVRYAEPQLCLYLLGCNRKAFLCLFVCLLKQLFLAVTTCIDLYIRT